MRQESAARLEDVVAGAGRMCPRDYAYSPSVLNRPPEIVTDVLYVVGGLYGNLQALDALERLIAAEPQSPTVVFNGDFHWFDAEPEWFAEVERRIAPYPALRGNIETEIARLADIGAGCGCAYPPYVCDEVVRRSNAILSELRATVPAASPAAQRIAALPMHLVAAVGDLRVGIVHGDAASLGGWRFDRPALDDRAQLPWLNDVRAKSRIDIFASTHTCVAALRDFELLAGRTTVINNGAAGLPNFANLRAGLATRIAKRPSPHPPLYGLVRDGVYIDAVAVAYDHTAFLDRFLRRWRTGSPAHESYYQRIVAGPSDTIVQAAVVSTRAESATAV